MISRRRTQRGFSMLEIMTGLSLFTLMLGAIATLLITGLRSLDRTSTSVSLSESNARGLRRVNQTLREAMAIAVSADGTKISYMFPARSATKDPITGEAEIVDPMVGDGVERYFIVNEKGELTDGARVYVRSIASVDPDPDSSQYKQPYQPFQLTTIGATRALSINLITRNNKNARDLYFRMKTTVVLRNGR